MSSLLEQLDQRLSPSHPALEDAGVAYSWQQLRERALALAGTLSNQGVQRVALHADNGVDWLLVDLACQHAGIPCVPLPLFFSDLQRGHVLASAGIDAVFTPLPDLFLTPDAHLQVCPALGLSLVLRDVAQAPLLPEGTGKITPLPAPPARPRACA
jgi:long-chain acyl-CoA synthetase